MRAFADAQACTIKYTHKCIYRPTQLYLYFYTQDNNIYLFILKYAFTHTRT